MRLGTFAKRRATFSAFRSFLSCLKINYIVSVNLGFVEELNNAGIACSNRVRSSYFYSLFLPFVHRWAAPSVINDLGRVTRVGVKNMPTQATRRTLFGLSSRVIVNSRLPCGAQHIAR